MLSILDILFTVLHVALMLFNLTGWIWKKTRRLHLVVLLATAASWGLLGIWYGWGYCPLTDWHWDVKAQLGEGNLPNSFVKYLADKLFSADFPSKIIDRITLGGLIFSVLGAIVIRVVENNKPRRSA